MSGLGKSKYYYTLRFMALQKRTINDCLLPTRCYHTTHPFSIPILGLRSWGRFVISEEIERGDADEECIPHRSPLRDLDSISIDSILLFGSLSDSSIFNKINNDNHFTTIG